jgi:outer membrane lipoprotein-sorting protein
MPKYALLAIQVLLWPTLAHAITAEEIVKRMDQNMTFGTRIMNASLTIVRPNRGRDIKKMKTWGKGADQSYSVFLAPARDKGIKYLKRGDKLYMYLPRTEKVMKISGHLLRQSVMDSDFSYEDMLEAHALLDNYAVKIVGEEELGGEQCWIIDMTARVSGVAYARRKVWVGKNTMVARRSERYAKSGLLLKLMTTDSVVKDGKRYYAQRTTMQDKLKKGTRTILGIKNVRFNKALPARIFSRRHLMRGD